MCAKSQLSSFKTVREDKGDRQTDDNFQPYTYTWQNISKMKNLTRHTLRSWRIVKK